MASIVIRNVDDRLKQRIRARAADHGQSMEAEARDILEQALDDGDSIPLATNLYDAIRRIVEPLGGIELDLAPREPIREPPKSSSIEFMTAWPLVWLACGPFAA